MFHTIILDTSYEPLVSGSHIHDVWMLPEEQRKIGFFWKMTSGRFVSRSRAMPGTTVDMDSCGTLRMFLEVVTCFRFSFLTVESRTRILKFLKLLSKTLC